MNTNLKSDAPFQNNKEIIRIYSGDLTFKHNVSGILAFTFPGICERRPSIWPDFQCYTSEEEAVTKLERYGNDESGILRWSDSYFSSVRMWFKSLSSHLDILPCIVISVK